MDWVSEKYKTKPLRTDYSKTLAESTIYRFRRFGLQSKEFTSSMCAWPSVREHGVCAGQRLVLNSQQRNSKPNGIHFKCYSIHIYIMWRCMHIHIPSWQFSESSALRSRWIVCGQTMQRRYVVRKVRRGNFGIIFIISETCDACLCKDVCEWFEAWIYDTRIVKDECNISKRYLCLETYIHFL